MQMMVRYHSNRRRQSLGDLISPEHVPKMQRRFAAGSNPSWAEWRQWAIELGFKPLNLTPTAMGVYHNLSRYGPIMYSGTWGATFDGHVVVLTGINTAGPTLYVDDPLETTAPVSKAMNTYFARLTQSLWENPLFVYDGR
jgi:hypothetical protein